MTLKIALTGWHQRFTSLRACLNILTERLSWPENEQRTLKKGFLGIYKREIENLVTSGDTKKDFLLCSSYAAS